MYTDIGYLALALSFS